MHLDDYVFLQLHECYFLTYESVGVTPWRALRKKHPLFFQVLINFLTKPKGIIVDLAASTCINPCILL